jgi:outer membrane protein OmpA-like peptidoglycan-associated protein
MIMEKKILSKVLLGLTLIFLVNAIHAQTFINKNAVGMKFLLLDYKAPYNSEFGNFRGMDNGLELSYSRNISKNLNVYFPLRLAVIRPFESEINFQTLSTDMQFQIQFWKDESRFNPFVLFGAGLVYDSQESLHMQVPLGGGIEVKLSDFVFLNFQLEGRFAVSDNRNNIQLGIGVKTLLSKRVYDRDGDGVPDHLDACPDIPGPISTQGCPDRDGDGIPDHMDACPDIPGEASAQGCPDRDGDGIADFEDLCPDEVGLPEWGGCPEALKVASVVPDSDTINTLAIDLEPIDIGQEVKSEFVSDQSTKSLKDSDGDGIPDVDDKCPLEPGPAWNRGCPEIKEEDKKILRDAMKEVQFDIGKSTLRLSSFNILDQIVDLMRKYPEYMIVINGHTDNTGSAELNQKLSEDRAKTCYEYLMSKGISQQRMSYRGYGQSRPIYSNNNEIGRSLNRRVEFRMLVL